MRTLATAASVALLACAGFASPAAARTDLGPVATAAKLKAGDGVETGRELTPALHRLYLELPKLRGAERRRAERLLARPVPGQGNAGESTYSTQEAAPVCGTHFCIHYVATTGDAPPGGLDYVNTMLREFENVYAVQNGQLGWRAPRSDAGRGGNDLTDVYIKNIGAQGIFGYSAADPGQRGRQVAAYLVLDNDYSQAEYRNYPNFLEPLQVTAAHEYNHVLQFGYDAAQDTWLFEATAVWMEDKVYDGVDDYRNYLPEWARRSTQPLTQFLAQGNNVKVYGDAVLNRWVETRYGAETIRRLWEVSAETRSFAPGAFDKALGEKGSNFVEAFSAFAADTAEWRASNSPFEEGAAFPDMERVLGGAALRPQNVTGNADDFVTGRLNHTSYALLNVDARGQGRVTVGGTVRPGVSGAVGLVGRTGDPAGGTYTVALAKLPRGGAGRATLDNAAGFSRVTAVIINADVGTKGFSRTTGDWVWTGDRAPVTLAVGDETTPRLTRVRVAGKIVRLSFSEGVVGASGSSVTLLGPDGRKVRARVSTRGSRVTLRISRALRRGTRYSLKLTGAVTDAGGNRLARTSRTKRFRATG